MLQGLMFLPDGRVLIMDQELYKQTIEKSIVLDLFDSTSLSPSQPLQLQEDQATMQAKQAPRLTNIALDVQDDQGVP